MFGKYHIIIVPNSFQLEGGGSKKDGVRKEKKRGVAHQFPQPQCYRTVFLRVIVTIQIRMLQDNFDGY
jgi:hypothetical protein